MRSRPSPTTSGPSACASASQQLKASDAVRGALCGGERRQRPSQLWQREHGRVVLDQSMKIRLDGVEVAVRLERRGLCGNQPVS